MVNESSELKFEVQSPLANDGNKSEGSVLTSLKEIQSWWEVASIVHFSSVFRPAFDLPEFEFDEFEEALMRDRPGEENLFLCYLTIDLLKGCLRTHEITFPTFNKHLREFVASASILDPGLVKLVEDDREFNDLKTYEKVRLINAICDYRLTTPDAIDKTADVDADSLRIEPLGTDSKGTTYWYFYGSRLYAEEAPPTPPPHLANNHDASPKKKSKKKKKKMEPVVTDDELPMDLTAPSRDEVYGQWYLAASSVVEWEAIADMYKDAKRSRDQELYSVINENFLPILPSVVEAEEKAKMKRMQELACTRQSSRLEEKRKEREMLQVKEDEERKAEEIEKREAARVAAREEEQRKAEAAEIERAQREEAKAALRDERKKRVAMREERATLIREGKPLPAYLLGTSCESPMTSPTHNSFEVADSDSTLDTSSGNSRSGSSAGKRRRDAASRRGEWRKNKNCSSRYALSGESSAEGDESLDDDDIVTGSLKVLTEVEAHKDASVFVDPVTDEIAPGYTSIIKNPICLRDIYKKIQHKSYTSINTFVQDGLRMFENCHQYNGKNSEYGQIATKVRTVFVNAVRKHFGVTVAVGRGIKTLFVERPDDNVSESNGSQPKKAKLQDANCASEDCKIPTHANGHNSSSSSSSNNINTALNLPVTPDRRKQNLINDFPIRDSKVSKSPALASQEMKSFLENGGDLKVTNFPSFKRDVRLPSMFQNKKSFAGYQSGVATKSSYPIGQNSRKSNEASVQESKQNSVANSANAGSPGKQNLIGPKSNTIVLQQRPANNSNSGKPNPLLLQYSRTNGNAVPTQISMMQLGFTGSPKSETKVIIQQPSEITPKQAKDEELTVRLQQHTQETVKNFLRVTNSAANGASPRQNLSQGIPAQQHTARANNAIGQKSPSAQKSLGSDIQIGYVKNPGIVVKRPVPVSFNSVVVSNRPVTSDIKPAGNVVQLGPNVVVREEIVNSQPATTSAIISTNQIRSGTSQSNLTFQPLTQNRTLSGSSTLNNLSVSINSNINNNLSSNQVINAIPVKIITSTPSKSAGNLAGGQVSARSAAVIQTMSGQKAPDGAVTSAVQFITASANSSQKNLVFTPDKLKTGTGNFSHAGVKLNFQPFNASEQGLNRTSTPTKVSIPANTAVPSAKGIGFVPLTAISESGAKLMPGGAVKQINIVNPEAYKAAISAATHSNSHQKLNFSSINNTDQGKLVQQSSHAIVGNTGPGHINSRIATLPSNAIRTSFIPADQVKLQKPNSSALSTQISAVIASNAQKVNEAPQPRNPTNTPLKNAGQSNSVSGVQYVFTPFSNSGHHQKIAANHTLPLSSPLTQTSIHPQNSIPAGSVTGLSSVTMTDLTMSGQNQTTSTIGSHEMSRNSKAISTNQHLPLSGKPTTA